MVISSIFKTQQKNKNIKTITLINIKVILINKDINNIREDKNL